MKRMVFVLACLVQMVCFAEHIILNFWQDVLLESRHPIQIPLSFVEQSTVFKIIFDETERDLSKIDEHLAELPFTCETMEGLLKLTNSFYANELRSSTDIDIVVDENIAKKLHILEAARFFNVSLVVVELQNIILQECKDCIYEEEKKRTKFYKELLMYFSSYAIFSELWLRSQSWERMWHLKYNQSETFYLGHRPKSYSIFTLMLHLALEKNIGPICKGPTLQQIKCA